MEFSDMFFSNLIFLNLQTAADTVPQCTLEDLERNDGSAAEAYLMTEERKLILN